MIDLKNNIIELGGKKYVKIAPISNELGDFEMLSPLEHPRIGVKFVKVIKKKEQNEFEEVDQETSEELTKRYTLPPDEYIYDS